MPDFSLKWVAQATQGKIESDVHSVATNICTDSRNIQSGSLFIALRGANFDAHDFLGEVLEKGIKIAIVDQPNVVTDLLKSQISVVLVEDTLIALQNLAHSWRKSLKAKIMAVTGSNGKTTTKEFASQIIGTQKPTFASPGNFNNHWGVPLSLLSIEKDIEVAVIEMGMSQLGELSRLCEIAAPDVVLVTMVGSAHIGEVGSQEDIYRAKKEVYDSCSDCTKVFNIDNEFTIRMYEQYKNETQPEKIITFSSFNKSANVSLRVEEMTLDSILLSGHIKNIEGQCKVSVFGRHNINNVMAASCLALAAGLAPDEIWQALPLCHNIWGRNQLLNLKNGAQVLFDAYNASFESMSALVKSIFEFDLKGSKSAIIGQMLELGEESAELHRKLGELVAKTGFENVWFMGPDQQAFASGMRDGGFEKNLLLSDSYKESLAIQLGSMLNPLDVAIIKGSRGMKMEMILDTWRDHDII